jgi:hypothetical protein
MVKQSGQRVPQVLYDLVVVGASAGVSRPSRRC